MADPKFANLPGIAYDQPDVYETADVAEPETSDYYEEEPENESIERLHISTKDSYSRFKGKELKGNVDFSDRIGKQFMRRGYDSYDLIGEGEKETPVQKCQRLQIEINELLNEVSALQVDKQISKEEKESYDAVATVISTAKKVLDSLRLEQILGKEELVTASEKQLKNLIGQVDEFKKSGILTPIPIGDCQLNQSTRIATLEHRLHELEKAIGAKPEKLSRLSASVGSSNLLEAVQQLSTKAALLQPQQLDLIEARLNVLAQKMDAIAEKSAATNQELQRDQKVLELYEIAKRTESVTQVLPDMLERMQALESLHKYATNFTKIITELEGAQSSISNGIANNKTLLQGVQKTFAESIDSTQKEIKNLDDRIQKISTMKK